MCISMRPMIPRCRLCVVPRQVLHPPPRLHPLPRHSTERPPHPARFAGNVRGRRDRRYRGPETVKPHPQHGRQPRGRRRHRISARNFRAWSVNHRRHQGQVDTPSCRDGERGERRGSGGELERGGQPCCARRWPRARFVPTARRGRLGCRKGRGGKSGGLFPFRQRGGDVSESISLSVMSTVEFQSATMPLGLSGIFAFVVADVHDYCFCRRGTRIGGRRRRRGNSGSGKKREGCC